MKRLLLLTTALVSLFGFTDAFAYEDLIISSGTHNRNNMTNQYNSITINGGTVNLNNFNIYSATDAFIRGGTVTATNGGGINARNGNFDISGGTINITSGSFDGGVTNISGTAQITLNSETDLTADTEMNIIGGTITALSENNIGVDGKYLNISGGIINLSDWSALYATPENSDDIPAINITGGTINLKGKGFIVSNTVEEFYHSPSDEEAYLEKYTAGEGHISGGTINVTGMGNGIVMQNPDLGGVLNIAANSSLGVWKNYDENIDEDTLEFFNKSTLLTTDSGIINLNGGKLEANVAGSGTVKVNTAGSIIDGDFDGADLDIYANTTLSDLISGNISSFGNLHIYNGKFVLDKLPDDEDSALKGFTLERGASFEGIGVASTGEINIKGGTVNISDGIYLETANNQYSIDAADLNISGGNITVTGIKDDEGEEPGEITLTGNANLNISGADTVINMDFSDINKYNDGHDGGILHEGKTGDINISGGTINLKGEYAKIERGGYDGDWIYDNDGNALMTEDEFHDITGKWLTEDSVSDDDIRAAGLDPQTVDRSQYHISTGDINITGGTVNLLNEDARISTTYKNTGNINISNARIVGEGYISTKSAGDINIDEGSFVDVADITAGGSINISGGTVNLAHKHGGIYSYYHENSDNSNVNITGGTVNLSNGAGIYATSYNNPTINITGGKITSVQTQLSQDDDDWVPGGRIQVYGDGELNIKGNAILDMQAGDIQKGHHRDGSERAKGDVNISENAQITLYDDSHINSDQDVNISGGTINLYNNGTIDAYGDINITGGNITIGKVDVAPVSLEEDGSVWSAVSSHYKDGNVYMSGGELTLYNNAALGRSANIDEDMDIEQFGDEITGNIEISGGTISANGNSLIWLGGADGEGEAGEAMAQKIASGEIVEKGDIIISGANTEITLNDDASIALAAHGKIDIKDGAKVYMNGRAKIANALAVERDDKDIGDVKISSGSILNINGNNTIEANYKVYATAATLNIDEDATLSVDSLKVKPADETKPMSNKAIYSEDSLIDLQGTLNADILDKGGSQLTFSGQKAKLNGNAENLGELVFNNANTDFANQILTADSISLNGSTLDFNGDVVLRSLVENIELFDDSLININEGENTIEAAKDIVLNDSDLYVKDGASLTLNVGEDYYARFNNGHIYIEGTLLGNVIAQSLYIGDGGIIEGGTYESAEINGKRGNISQFITDGVDAGDLLISNASNVTLDKSKVFVVSDDNRRYAYETDGYYTLISDENDFDEDEDGDIRNYENQIRGTLKLDNSTLKLNTNLAAKKFVIDNHSTLNAQNKIIGGKSLLVDNYSTANLQHTNSRLWNESGFSNSIVVDHDSVLNITSVDIGNNYNNHSDYVHILNGSSFNMEDDGISVGQLRVDNSTISAKNADFTVKLNAETPTAVFENANIDLNNSFAYTHGITKLDNSTATLANRSALTANQTIIENSTITANNSHVGAFKKAIDIDVEDRTIYNDILHGLHLTVTPTTDLTVNNSEITLNGNSELGAAMAIVEDSEFDHIIGYLTPEMLQDKTLLKSLNSKYRNYDMEDFDDSSYQNADQYKAQVYIVGSSIVLNDNAKIVNAMLNADEGKISYPSGGISINGSSTITVNGNNTLSASDEIDIYNSNVIINKGATLNVESSKLVPDNDIKPISHREIYLSNTTVDLRGTLNGDIGAKNDTVLNIYDDAVLNGNVNGLNQIIFNDANTILKNQSLTVNEVILDKSTVDITGGVYLSVYDSLKLVAGSILNVSGTNNDIYAQNSVELNNSVINIKKNSQLSFNVGEDGVVELNNGAINVYEGSSLSGNVKDLAQLTFISGPSIQEDQFVATNAAKISAMVNGKITNLGDLVILNHKNLNIDKNGLFVLAAEDAEYARQYESGNYNRKKYYADESNIDDDDEDDDADPRFNYENQIIGKLQIKNSSVTSSTNFAADEIVVDNSTLNVTDHILGAKTLSVSNGSKVNLLGKNAYALSGFDDGVNISGGSILTTNYLQVGAENSANREAAHINISGGSTYNITNGEVYTGTLNVVDNSTLNATNVRLKAEGNEMNFDASALNANGSFIQTEGDLFITQNGDNKSNISLKANSTLTAENNTGIYGSTVVANNSNVGVFKHAIKIETEDKEVKNKLHYYSPYDYDHQAELNIVLNVDNSEIKLSGNSRLGAGMAIVNWKSSTQGVVEGLITRDLYDNPNTFLNDKRFKGYDFENFEDGFERAANYQAFVTIDNSNIVMEGTSSIINAALNTQADNASGDIKVYNSAIEVKGNNTTISAAKDIKLTDSSLTILRGAVLNIFSDTAEEQFGKDITLDGTLLDLGGVIKGNVSFADSGDAASQFILNGGRVEGTVSGLKTLAFGVGQNGNTSATLKGMKFTDIQNLNIAGTTINGKTTAPKITIDSDLFELSDEDARRYYGYYKDDKEYYDYLSGVNKEQESRYVDIVTYNQITGDVNIENGATLTLNKALAAENFNVDNATLVSNNALMYGNLSLDNKATAIINGSKMDIAMKAIKLANNSTLNLNSVEYIEMNSLTADNANLNINKWTELGVGNLSLTNNKTTISAGGAWVMILNANIDGGSLNIADADVTFKQTNMSNVDVTLAKRTIFALNNANVSGGKITLNDNSKIVTSSDGEYVYDGYFGSANFDMKFTDSILNLNGSSGVDLAVVKLQYVDEGRDKDLGYHNVDLRGNVVFDNATINMTDTARISNKAVAADDEPGSGNIMFANGTILNIKGKNNSVTANNLIEMHNSALNIAKGATLSVISAATDSEVDKTLYVSGSEINLAGILKANLVIEDDDEEIAPDTKFILNGGRVEGMVSGLKSVGLGAGQNGNTSSTLKGMKFADIKNLSIEGTIANGKTTAPKINLDSSVFSISDEENKKYYAYDKKAKGYINLGTWENVAQHYANDERYEVHAFDNQINGNVEIKDGASLTINSALAANTFELDNKATLVANNARIDGNLRLNNNSTATIGGKTSDVSMGAIELNNNSTLNLNAIEWMGIYSLSADNSKLNISNKADLDAMAGVSLKDTITNITSACMWENDNATSRTLDINGGTLNATASQIGFFNTLVSGAKVTASKGTIWAVGAANIFDSTIMTLNDNSKILTGGYDDQDYENKEEYFNEFSARYDGTHLDISFTDSTVNLNGTSAIETSILQNDDIAVKGNIKFDNSEVNMNGTSSIKNMAKVNEVYEETTSGDVIFAEGSVLNANGKSNVLSANGIISIDNSTLNIAKGATLNVTSYASDKEAENTLYAAGSIINLGGVLRADLYIHDDEEATTKSALILNGGRIVGSVVGLEEVAFGTGQNGKTSATLKGTLFENIKDLSITGTVAANGKVSAPNITLDSSVFTISDGARAYAYNKFEKENIDEANWWMLDEYDEEYLDKNCQENIYENQVLGDVNVSNKATLNVNKALAAENINIDNATLVSNNGLLYGHLNLNNNATATINGAMLKMDLPDIAMSENSTLNLNAVEYLSMENMLLENSKLNTSKYAEILIRDTIQAIDSNINIKAGGTWLQAYQSYLSGGALSIEDADIRFDNTQIYSNKLTLSKNTILGVNNADILNAIININDKSRLVTDFDYVSKYEPDEIYSDVVADMQFNGSVVNLNASASIEQNVIFEDGDSSGRGKILPKEVAGLKGNIVFSNTVVNMNGTSAIKNLADAEINSGDINFNDNSKLNVRGKNNIAANGNINIENSTLDVAKGAVLNNLGNSEIVFSNARLKWIGTINSDMSGSVSTLILGATAPSDKYNVNLSGLTSFGISGISSKKDITKAYNAYLNMGGSEVLDTFEITDKSSFTYDNATDIVFNNLNVENATLTLAAGDRNIGNIEANSGSTVKVAAGAKVYADNINIYDSSFTVSGKARGRNETEYADELRAIGGIHIDNENNTKASVNVVNTNIDEMSVLMTANTIFNNVKSQGLFAANYGVKNARVTLSNVELLGDLTINDTTTATLNNVNSASDIKFFASDITKDKKGNNVYNTATFTGVSAEALEINNTKAIMQKNNAFSEISVVGDGYLDIRSTLDADIKLENTSVAVLAAKQQLNGNTTLDENTTFNLQGKINGDVGGNRGMLNITNSTAVINGNISDVNVTFSNVKNKLSSLFIGDVANIGRTELKNSTLTADKDDFAYGDLALERSSLVLADNGIAQVQNLNSNASTLNLGTGKLQVSGDAILTNKSNITLRVDDVETYGQLIVGGILTLGVDAQNKPTTNLTVTLNKKLALDVAGGKTYDFNFLDYGSVDGTLNNVTIANNRFAFVETGVGQFSVEEKTKANTAVTRYAPQKLNAARAAAAMVDSGADLTSVQQNITASGLNDLSQVVGGEDKYIAALEATNPDDNNMVLENTLNTIALVTAAAKERTAGGVSIANGGLASGDTPNGITMWAKVLHNRSKLNANASYSGFKSTNNGLAMGADKIIWQNLKLGLGYAYTDGEIKNNNRRTDVDTHLAMLYGEYKPADWFVNGFVSYGWSDYKSKANSVIGTTKSDFDVYATQVQANIGYDVKFAERAVLTPIAGLRYVNITQDDYKDSDDKHISKVHNDVITAIAGIKLKKSYEFGNNMLITPEAHLGLSYDIVHDNNGSVVRLSNGTSYVVEGRALERLAYETDFGVTAELGDNLELGVGYEGTFRKDYQDHTGILNFQYKF